MFQERCPHCGDKLFKRDGFHSFMTLYYWPRKLWWYPPEVHCKNCNKISYRAYPMSKLYMWSNILQFASVFVVTVPLLFSEVHNSNPDLFIIIVLAIYLALWAGTWFGLQSRGLFTDYYSCPPPGSKYFVVSLKKVEHKKQMVRGFVYDIKAQGKADAVVHLEEKGNGEYLFRVIKDDDDVLLTNSEIEIITRNGLSVPAVIEREFVPAFINL